MQKIFCLSIMLLVLAATAWASGDAYDIQEIDGEMRACIALPSGEIVPLENVSVTFEEMIPHAQEPYYWFGVGPKATGDAKTTSAIILKKEGTQVGLFLPLPEAESCLGVWFSPDEKKLLLSIDTEPLSTLAVYDLLTQQVQYRVPNTGWGAWLDDNRFAYTAYDPEKKRGREGVPGGGSWSSVMVCEILGDTEIVQHMVRPATETEDYALNDLDTTNFQLIIMKEFVRFTEDWSDPEKIMFEERPFPYPAVG